MSNNRGMSAEFEQSLTKATVNAQLELYDFDLTGIGGDMLYLHNGLNGFNQPLVWQGRRYEPYPIQGANFELTGQGPPARPTLTLSDAYGLVTGLANRLDGLSKGVVIRRQTSTRYLDAVNFSEGNPTADPTQEVVSRYVIERLFGVVPKKVAMLELASPAETDGAKIPGRPIFANVCGHIYRQSCPYRGKPVADRFDLPTKDPLKDDCSRSIQGCRARFFANGVLPFDGAPSIDKLA